MKALCAFFVSVVFLVAVCCVNEADAQYKWSGFFLGTLGVHTVDGTAFGGLTGFLGGSKNNSGLGIMGSYEAGSKTIWGYNVQLRLINVYFSATYRLGQSMFILFQGVSTVIALLRTTIETTEAGLRLLYHVCMTLIDGLSSLDRHAYGVGS